MASDFKIVWDNDYFEGDIKAIAGDFLREDGLTTAVYMSLFTDRRAGEDEILPDPSNDDRRGWWGDQISDYDNDEIGSFLWLLERSKTTQDVVVKAEAYIKDALEWMTEDGVAANIEVEVERIKRSDGSSILAAKIQIMESDGQTTVLEFDDLWQAQFGLN